MAARGVLAQSGSPSREAVGRAVLVIAMLLCALVLLGYALVFIVQALRVRTEDLAERDAECSALKLELGTLLQAEKERISPSRDSPIASLTRAFQSVAVSFESLR